jgi:hypothetical protein
MSLHTPPPSPSTNPNLWSISNMPYYSNTQLPQSASSSASPRDELFRLVDIAVLAIL